MDSCTSVKDYKPLENRNYRFTRMEMDVISLAVRGFRNRDISVKLSISERTVKSYLTCVYRKLGIDSRYKLIVWGMGGNLKALKRGDNGSEL